MKRNYFKYDELFYILQKYLSNYNPFKSALKLKDFLKIGANDIVKVSHIEKIEKKIKYVGINVIGDESYTSKLNKAMELNLIFENNKFVVNHDLNKKVNYESFKERKILMINKTDSEWIGFDGENTIQMNEKLQDDILKFKTEYIMTIKTNEKLSIESEYKKYLADAIELKDKTNGEINFFKTGTIKRTALKLFDTLTKHITPEFILYDEAKIIQFGTRGQLVFCDEGYEGIGYKSDIVSMYPAIMKSNKSLVPICTGEFKRILKEDFEKMRNSFFAYGLYNVNVVKCDNEKINRLFRFNKDNFYTSIDLKLAKYLGLDFNLLDESEFNSLLYARKKCLLGNQVFAEYVDRLYKLKKDKVKGAKLLLNFMSGAISETNKTVIKIDEDDIEAEDIDLEAMNYEVIKKTIIKNTRITKYTVIDKDYYFKSRFARFKPFMLASARLQMAQIIFPNIEHVVKVKTDGIISTIPLTYSDELGSLKYEGFYKNIKIYNNEKIEADYIKDYLPEQ